MSKKNKWGILRACYHPGRRLFIVKWWEFANKKSQEGVHVLIDGWEDVPIHQAALFSNVQHKMGCILIISYISLTIILQQRQVTTSCSNTKVNCKSNWNWIENTAIVRLPGGIFGKQNPHVCVAEKNRTNRLLKVLGFFLNLLTIFDRLC